MNLLEARDKFDENSSSLLNILNTVLFKKDNLFNDLTKISEERLDVIQVLDAEVNRLSEEVKTLSKKEDLWEQ